MIINFNDYSSSNTFQNANANRRKDSKKKAVPKGKVVSMMNDRNKPNEQPTCRGMTNVFHLYLNGDFLGNATIHFSSDGMRVQNV